MIIFNKLKSYRYMRTIKASLKSVGNNVVFNYAQFHNPKYISIGDNCFFGPNCRIEAWDKYAGETFAPAIDIGKNVRINSGIYISSIKSISIGNDCLFGNNVTILDNSHGTTNIEDLTVSPAERKLFSKGEVVIGDKCWVGSNVVILAGVTIGESCVIGSNAVITHDVPPFSVAVGNPARIVKKDK